MTDASHVKFARTPVLSIGYEDHGEASGFPIILLHGFPYDIRSFDGVVPPLVEAGYRVLVPYLRGYGATRFLDPKAPRMAEQAAIGQDVVDFAEALRIEQLSSSRLNHGQPGVQAHPEIVQGATELHHQSTDPLLPQVDPVFHDAAALDTPVDVLDAQPPLVERLIRPLLLPRQLLAAGFLGRHEDHHLRECERQEPQILQEPAPRWQGIRRRVRHGLIMGATAVGVTECQR